MSGRIGTPTNRSFRNLDRRFPNLTGKNRLMPGFVQAEFKSANAREECPDPHSDL
jgi:hypothetical protein